MNINEIVNASNGKLESKEVEKNGKKLNGVFIKNNNESEMTTSSIIYEDGVEHLTENCSTVEEAATAIYDYLSQCNQTDSRKEIETRAREVLSDMRKLYDNLQIRVVLANNVGTKEPIKTVGDIAFYYQVFFDGIESASALIPKDSIEHIKEELNVSDTDIWNKAVENTEKEMHISHFGIMPIVSNNMGYYGASSVFVSGTARLKIAEKLGIDEYYIIPSSVHEVIVVPSDIDSSVEELKVMLDTVNPTMDEFDVLSEHIYFVDNEGNLSVAC